MNYAMPVSLTKNHVVNKLLLSDLGLEDYVSGPLWVIDKLRCEYLHRRISKKDLVYALYSKYEIDKHIHEYDDDTLLILVEFGLEYEKIALVEDAYAAKREIIDRFQCLYTLAHDEIGGVSQSAKQQLERLDEYSRRKRECLEVFQKINQVICRARFLMFTSKIRVTNRRPSHFRHEHYEKSKGIITYTRNGFRFDITIPVHPTYNVSEWEEYQLKCIFDKYSRNEKGIHLRKSNLTLDRLVDLVHVFFENLD